MKLFGKVIGKGGGDRKGPLTGKTLTISDQQVEVGAVLGEGGFATVYRAVDVATQTLLALKHFRLSGDPEAVRDVKTEVAIMRAAAACPHILRLHSVAFSGPPGAEVEAVLLMDLAQQSLPVFLQARGYRLDDYTALAVFLPVCRAVQALHGLKPPVAHRDIKAENVLLNAAGTWQLCDFGSASSLAGVVESAAHISREEDVITKTTTPAYRAPELWDLWSRQPIGLPGDIWALGCLLYLLCFGALPFDGSAKLSILNGRYSLPEGRPPALRSLIQRMLATDPRARPNIAAVVAAVEAAAAAESPDLARPLPPSVQQAVAAQQQHQRSMSHDWRELAGSRGPSDSGGPATAPYAPAAAAPTSTADDFAGWASFDSPKQPAAQQPEAASRPAAAAGLFWEQFGAEAASAGPLSAGVAQLHRVSGGSASVGSRDEAVGGAQLTGSSAEGGAGGGQAGEVVQLRELVAQLREHAQVLESLLEARTQEVAALQSEVAALRRQAAQQQVPAARSGSLSVAPPRQVELAPSGRVAGDAPTPTFPGSSSSSRLNGGGRPAPPTEELRTKLSLAGVGGNSNTADVQRSSARTWPALSSGSNTPSGGGSPMRARPLASGHSSPPRHTRNLSAPSQGFFSDLNPLS